MRQFGAVVDLESERITIPEGEYKPTGSRIEADWTAASYFYEMLVLVGARADFYSGFEIG